MPRHFLTGTELSSEELDALLDRALELKAAPRSSRALDGRSVALVFEKPSTRTRVSFEVGVVELGGHPVVLRGDELQISRGEALRDTALVLSRHVDAVGVRTGPQASVEELARYSDMPVFNMLTAEHHPCQALADLLTLREAYGELDGLRLAYVGDGNNVARSLALLGGLAGVEVVVASPEGYELERGRRRDARPRCRPRRCAARAAVYTDVWVSMGDEATADARRAALAAYRVDDALLDRAAPQRVCAARPAGPCGRGDHCRGALRLAPADLGPGGEPTPRAEGAARMAARVSVDGREPRRQCRRRARAARRLDRLRRRRRRAAQWLRRIRRRRVSG